ncbi:MAG: T9SS type A sorting domain-containing protein, partial [Bacteroidales bacterium]|nr:T9SS type A sorting domain-containing protein [Bacteroidales bacterium]
SEGYLVKMFASGEIIYPASSKSSGKTIMAPTHFKFEGGNAADPVYTIYVNGLAIGDEVAAFDGSILLGSVKINSQNVFDNDLPTFSTINSGNGYKTGNPIILKVWDASTQSLIPFKYTYADPYNEAYMEKVYPSEDGLYSVIQITKGVNNIENTENNISIFPNPSEGIFNISIENLTSTVQSSSEKVQIKVFDVHGNYYRFFEIEGTGNLTEKLDLKELPAGVYFINFNCKDFKQVKKIVIQ